VREAHDQLIDDAALADRPRDGDRLHVRRDLVQEVVGVEVVQFRAPAGADHQRHQVDVGICRHCRQSLLGAVRAELGSQVLVPGTRQGSFGFHLIDSSQGE
jgi:hypothetical protein